MSLKREKKVQRMQGKDMGLLSTALACLCLLMAVSNWSWSIAMALDEEWKLATATCSRDADGSIAIGGACGFGIVYQKGYGEYTAALSSSLFNRGERCGACYEVRCVDHILWCLVGSPSVVVTTTDFCPPNYGLPGDYGGWCNPPREHFEMSYPAFIKIAVPKADIVPIQYRRVSCERKGGIRFTLSGSSCYHQVLITNVGLDGEVFEVKVKGSKTGWIQMGRNWGQNWQCNANLIGQPLSFEITSGSGRRVTSYNAAPADWRFGQTFEGIQL
ncbi:unnamed protein product [Victoria cruziana]